MHIQLFWIVFCITFIRCSYHSQGFAIFVSELELGRGLELFFSSRGIGFLLAFAVKLAYQYLSTGAAFFPVAGIMDQHRAFCAHPFVRRF